MSIYSQRSPNIFMKYHDSAHFSPRLTSQAVLSTLTLALPLSSAKELEALTLDLLHACSFRLGTFAASPFCWLPSATTGPANSCYSIYGML